jgi:uncharacterized membrane protein
MMTCTILGSAAFLTMGYGALPPELPVHFRLNGFPDGWQFKTPARVFLPVFVQLALALTLGSIGGLLLSRKRDGVTGNRLGSVGNVETDAPDVRAAMVAAEAVFLIALIWVMFQGYAAWALVQMWTVQRAGLGSWYNYLELAGGIVTIGVAIRAHRRLGRPAPRPFVGDHWRFGQLYKNPEDPALFVPTRDGRRWTLNFGRPVAAALLGVILLLGVVAPTVILAFLLRGD